MRDAAMFSVALELIAIVLQVYLAVALVVLAIDETKPSADTVHKQASVFRMVSYLVYAAIILSLL